MTAEVLVSYRCHKVPWRLRPVSTMRGAHALWILSIQAFFVSMLVLPTTFQFQRGVMLALLVGVAAMLAWKNWRVLRTNFTLWLATLITGAFGITWGIVNDAPGALRVLSVFIIWPAVYMLFIGLAHGLEIMRRIENALLLGISLAAAMSLIVFGAGLLGFGNIVFPLLAFQEASFGYYEGFVEFRILNLTTVMYGFPFVFSLLLARRRELKSMQRILLWVLLSILMLIAIGSGRRMFWLLVLLTPFLAVFFLQLSALRLRVLPMLGSAAKPVVIAVLAFISLTVAFDFQLDVLAQEFIAAFLGREESSGARYEQAGPLWDAFVNSPLIGNGLGSAVDVTRSTSQPWAYELSYLALLMNVGVLGFIAYSVAAGWIVLQGMYLARKNHEFASMFLPLLTAMSGFLIMNATNPYLGKFDFLWVIFLPVALINAYLTRRNGNA
jgi:hypothetical protein